MRFADVPGRPRILIALPAAFCLLLFATALPAQQATFKSKIELVRIDAVVVDKAGHAVRGLTQRDFALTDRKKSQSIDMFEEISHEPGATANAASAPAFPLTLKLDVATNTTIQADRLVMVMIDDLHIWKGRTDKTKDLARDIVTKLGNQASMALIFTSREGSTEITQDRSELLAAIDGMKARQTFRRPHQGFLDQKPAYVAPEDPNYTSKKNIAMNTAQQVSLQDFQDNLQYLKTLQDAAAMLFGEDQRRKAFVVISEGMSADMALIAKGATGDAGTADISGAGIVDLGGAGRVDIAGTKQSIENGAKDVGADATIDMMNAMRRSNVALYAIDPRGKVRSEDMMLESWPPPDCAVCNNPFVPEVPVVTERMPLREDLQDRRHNPVRMAQDSLVDTAEGSGGFAVTDTDDLTGGLNRILEDLDHYYLLGFYPTDTSNANRSHPVGLTVPGHPEYTIRFRRGYTPDAPPAPRPKNKDPLAELAAGVLPKSDLPLRLTALPLIGTGKTSNVAIAFEVTAPVGLMKEADSKLRDDVTYSVLVVDDKKSKVTQRTGRAATFSLQARDSSKPMPDSVTYQIPLTLDLVPGLYQLRASAMSKKLDKGGSVYLDITVPDFSKALSLSGMALGFADGARVPVGRTTIRTVVAGAKPGQAAVETTLPPAQARALGQTDQNRLPFEPTLSRELARTFWTPGTASCSRSISPSGRKTTARWISGCRLRR
jgi:VWFA-related protein